MIIDESAVRFVMMVNIFIEVRRIPDISDIVYRNIPFLWNDWESVNITDRCLITYCFDYNTFGSMQVLVICS